MGLGAGVAMVALLSRSALRRALKSSRGKSRRSAARRSSGATRGFTRGSGASGLAMIAWIASSSCSIRLRLAIFPTQPGPQILQAAELKLLHGSFGAPELLRDFADTLLPGEGHAAPFEARQIGER